MKLISESEFAACDDTNFERKKKEEKMEQSFDTNLPPPLTKKLIIIIITHYNLEQVFRVLLGLFLLI